MRFDGTALFVKFAAIVLIGWLCALPFIGWFAGLVTLGAVLFVLYHMRGFYSELEERDKDDDQKRYPDDLDDEGLGRVARPRGLPSSHLVHNEAPNMLAKLTELLGRLLGGTAGETPQKTGGLSIPDARSGRSVGLPAPLNIDAPPPDDIVDVPYSIIDPRRGTARPPARRPEPGPLSRPHPPIPGRAMSIADLVGEIDVSPDYQEEEPSGPWVDVPIIYPPNEHAGNIHQQQMRAYHWRCSGSSDAEIIRKVTKAWSSYMNQKHGERALQLGDVVIIDGRHYIIDRIGPKLVSYDEAEAWVRLEDVWRRQGFELAKRWMRRLGGRGFD